MSICIYFSDYSLSITFKVNLSPKRKDDCKHKCCNFLETPQLQDRLISLIFLQYNALVGQYKGIRW